MSGKGAYMDGAAMRVAGLFVAVGLTLSGCTGSSPDPEVTASSTEDSSGNSTPAVSASPSPSAPTKPERPDAMERDDAEGAAAAAEYFIELYPYVMATGDTEEFEAMSHRACGFCDDALEDIASFQANDQTYRGGEAKGDDPGELRARRTHWYLPRRHVDPTRGVDGHR
ncbi:DUF6318 family protein [Promicromonospora iranensis]|uniref:DUF6318 domain-containing protein n=1 Tax=Promicromonospora iranensis TaxID=1105144 RepID=A0ABU2CPT0_9MICO|nr:DUF6318 family protein [Promicromonospora iranensis]MDR7383344.1 hypothetical protein [Promicromonospora iranensis]